MFPLRYFVLTAWLFHPPGAAAAQVAALIVDDAGSPVDEAVVALLPASYNATATRAKPLVALDQVKKQFVPHVLAIEVGTALFFPNSDNIRHQVYSFSDTKRFEIKLYAGKTATPVVFDQPGVVVVGCNIHDWMSAYVYVVPTPFFALTDKQGRASIQLPKGDYAVRIWHPRHASGSAPLSEEMQVAHDTEDLHRTLTLAAADDALSGQPPL